MGHCAWRDAQTLKHQDLVDREDDYVRKITREIKSFDNVILEVCDEPGHIGTGFELAGPWVSHLIDVVRNTELVLPKKHLLGQEVDGPLGGPVDFAADSRVSVIVAQYIWGEDKGEMGGMKGLNFKYGENKPIELNETCYYPLLYGGDKLADSRVEVWEFIVGGGAGFNQLNGLFTVENPAGISPENEHLLRALENLVRFMNDFEFAKMAPDSSFLVRGPGRSEYHRTLSEPGRQYALYLHHSSEKIGGAYMVVRGNHREKWVLRLPAGRYDAKWIDPETGSTLESLRIQHDGGERTLTTPPYSVDLALALQRAP